MSLPDKEFPSTRTMWILLFVFSSYGFVKMINHDMVLVGVEDIMANTDYSSGWISAMLNIPYIFTTIILRIGCIQNRFTNAHRLWFTFLCIILGSLGVGFLQVVPLRIASVCLTGVGIASLQTAIMSLTVKYPDTVIHTYIICDACGKFLTPLIYTVFTTYLCINPRLVFISTAMISVIFPLYNHLILNKLTDYDYEPVHDKILFEREEVFVDSSEEEGEEEKTKGKTKRHDDILIPWSMKIVLLYRAFPRFYADFIGLAFQTLFFQSFFTTLVFSNSPFKPREHFQYYMFALCGGVFTGRLYGYIRRCSNADKESSLKTDIKSLIMVACGLCNFTVMFIAIWYRNMPNVWVVLALAFNTGLIAGVSYILCISPVSRRESHTVFQRSGTVVIHGVACVTAAMIAIVLEPIIRQRCFELTHTREFCIARYIGIGSKPCFRDWP